MKHMTLRIAAACCLVVSVSLGALAQEADAPPAPPPPPPGISEDDLKKLASDLEKSALKWDNATKPNGGRWTPPNEIDPAMDRRLAAVIYGEASVATLKTCLTSIKAKKPLDVYVANRLMEPLSRATPEVNKAMLPVIETLYTKYKYERFVQVADLKNLQIPLGASHAMLQTIKKRQIAKTDKEMEVVRYNNQVGVLGAHYFRTLARSNDPQYDKKLIDTIESMERQGIVPWLDALSALGGAQPMTEERATTLLKSKLATVEDALYMQHKTYTSRTEAAISSTAVSTFTDRPVDSGISVTNTMNVFRKAAGHPLRIVPSHVEVRYGYMPAAAKLPGLNKALGDVMRARPVNPEAIASAKSQVAATEGAMAAFTRVAGAGLTTNNQERPPDQVGAIFKRADDAGRTLAQAKEAGKAEYDKALATFAQQVHDSVLTPDQRKKIEPKPVTPPPAPAQ